MYKQSANSAVSVGCVILVPALKSESVFVCVTAVQWFLLVCPCHDSQP